MADHDQNSVQTESTALNTTLEPTTPEATNEATTETTPTEVSTNPETALKPTRPQATPCRRAVSAQDPLAVAGATTSPSTTTKTLPRRSRASTASRLPRRTPPSR